MDFDNTIVLASSQFIYGLGELIILVACIVLFIKHKSIATGLMLIGIVSAIFFTIGGMVFMVVANSNGAEGIIAKQVITSILGGLAHMLFSVGLFIFALRFIKKPVSS